MSLKTEYSRMAQKRITGVGIVPTVPGSDPIDDTWLATDLMLGEICINPDDDKMWIRTQTGIVEVATSVTSLQDLQEVLDEGSLAVITGDVDITADNFIFNDEDVKIGDNSAAPVTTTNTAKNAVLIASQNSSIDTGIPNSSVVASRASDITGGNESVIAGGSDNLIDIKWSVINGGSNNTINGINQSNFIGGGNFGTISGTSGQSSIIGGSTGLIDDSSFSAIIGGNNNDILNTSNYSAIVGGSTNLMDDGDLCVILGGQINIIDTSYESSIIGGYLNEINNTSYKSIIAGGESNIINSCTDSIIIGGSINDITGYDRTVILGGTGITAALDNAAYVPDLVIKKSHAIPANSADAVGDVGSITWDANYLYVKTAAGAWKRTALAAF